MRRTDPVEARLSSWRQGPGQLSGKTHEEEVVEQAEWLNLNATLTCPHCGHKAHEVMPTDRCIVVYDCPACARPLRPKVPDCCVFCSYADRPCPPVQDSTPRTVSWVFKRAEFNGAPIGLTGSPYAFCARSYASGVGRWQTPARSRWSLSHAGVGDHKHTRTHGCSERDRRNDEPRVTSGFTKEPCNL
jgi:hypothetical protein